MSAPRRENNPARRPDIPGFEGTWHAFDNLIKSGEAIIAKRKGKSEEDQIEDSFAQADVERGK